MPSVYACVFYTDAATGTKYVLIGKKRTQARWLDWNGANYKVPFQNPAVRVPGKVPYDIVNNPGQPVFPGGALNVATGETELNGAVREFREETGIDLSQFYPPAATIIVAPAPPNTIKGFNDRGQLIVPGAAVPAFSVVYFELPEANFWPVYWGALNNILYNNFTAQPNTQDDELDSVYCLPANNAAQWFTTVNDRSCNRKSTTWFSAILANIP